MNKIKFQIAPDFNGQLIDQGKGDSIKQIAEYWGNASIEAIHDRVLTWKSKRILQMDSNSELEFILRIFSEE